MTLAALGYVGYGVESTEGTIVAPTIYVPVTSFSFDSTNDYMVPDEVRGTRDRYVILPAPYSVSGSMATELYPNGIAALLKSAFSAGAGATVTSAYSGGGYQHVMTPGSAATPTFSFESSAGDVLIMRYGGIRVNTLEINAAFGEIVTATWGLEGTTRAKQGSTTSESYATSTPFHFTGAGVSVGGVVVGNIKSFTFSVGNNIERIGTLRKTRSWKRTALGMRDIGLTATMDFTDTADYDLFLNESEFDVDINLEADYISGSSGPKNTLRLQIPRVRWNTINAPLDANGYIEQSVTATVLRKQDNSPVVTVTLVNNESSVLGG